MSDSIFTQIINGEIPAHRVYEDRDIIAFLDIHPIRAGHTLVVPKKQVGSFVDMDDDDFKQLMATAQKIAKHIQGVIGSKRIVLNIDGSDTPDHVHVHLVPINHPDDSYRAGRMDEEPDHDSLRDIAQKLKIENQ